MIYYILKKEIEPKIVGVTHGAGQLKGSTNFEVINSWMFNLSDKAKKNANIWAKHELFAPKAEIGIILEKKAKKTDYIGDNNMRGFYINEKLKKILEDSHLPNHNFIPTIFTDEKTGQPIEGYYRFVYDMDTGENTVNFVQSEFDLKYHKQKLGNDFDVNIKSYGDYLKVFYDTGSAVDVSKLVFNKNFDKNLDIFGTQFLTMKSAYISDRLLKKMEEANITGYDAISPERAKRRAENLGDGYCELVFE